MKKIGLFWDKILTDNLTEKEMFGKVGLNTGNLIFIESLKSILNPEFLPRWTIGNQEYFNADDYDAFVTTDLIWLNEGLEYPNVEKALKRIGDKKLVPISVGIQAPRGAKNVSLHPNTIRLLSEISERCTMGIRGEFTASVLEKNGIKNMQIIGCPSMYYNLREQYNILPRTLSNQSNVICTFRTFYGRLSKDECHFLTYAANRNWSFVEQTQHKLDLSKASNDQKMFSYLNQWLERKEKVFFNAEEWISWAKKYDFSIGSRFHGNVVSLLNDVPALFFVDDNRMSEMCQLFHFPTMLMSEFDDKKPLEYYYEKADYTDFNRVYPSLRENFINFLGKNGLWE